MYLGTPKRKLRGLRGRGLGQLPASAYQGITQNSWNPFVFLPEDYNYIAGALTPNSDVPVDPAYSGLFDSSYNELYGTLTQNQVAQLKAQAAASIAQASGGNVALAQQQTAAADAGINSVVNTYGGVAPSGIVTLPGAPGGTFDPTDPSTWPWYLWAGLAVAAALAIKGMVK